MRSLLLFSTLLLASAAFAAEFVPGIAAADAGKIADPNKDEMYAYFIPAGTAPESIVAEITNHLRDTAKAKANFAVFGPDYALNARILKAALLSSPEGSLKGAAILYVNGGEDTKDLSIVAGRAGATFRTTKYSGK